MRLSGIIERIFSLDKSQFARYRGKMTLTVAISARRKKIPPDLKMTECQTHRILPHKLSTETPVSFIIGGLQYDGTFLQAIDSVLRVRDPFEDNYIATQAIKAATIGKP